MDGRTFLDFKISIPIHWHYKVWKSQDIFGLMLKSEDGLRVSKSWGNFHFCQMKLKYLCIGIQLAKISTAPKPIRCICKYVLSAFRQ